MSEESLPLKAREIFEDKDYTPFYFRDEAYALAETKNDILFNFLRTSSKKFDNANIKPSKNVQEYYQLLDDISDENGVLGAGLDKLLEEAGAEAINYFSKNQSAGIDGVTFGDIGNVEKIFKEKTTLLSQGIDVFAGSVTNALNNLINEVTKVYPELEELGIAEYLASSGNMPIDSKTKLDIINDALSTMPNGTLLDKNLQEKIEKVFNKNNENEAVGRSLAKIIERVQAIQILASGGVDFSGGNVKYSSNSSGVKNAVVKTESEAVQILMGKIIGGSSNLMGIFFEAALLGCLKKSDNEFKKAMKTAGFDKFFVYHSGNTTNGIRIDSDFTKDPAFVEWEQRENQFGTVSHSKEDIGFYIGNDKCIFQVGISMKKHTARTRTLKSGQKTKSTSIKIASTTTVDKLVKTYLAENGIDTSDRFLRSLLYSHDLSTKGASDTSLGRVWRSYVQNAALKNLSTYLMGNGDKYNNATLMIVNRRVVTMYDIINNIYEKNNNNNLLLKGISIEGADVSGMEQRKKNKWINAVTGKTQWKRKGSDKLITGQKDIFKAKDRSDAVGAAYINFLKTSVQISLNLTALGIQGF